MAPKTPKFGVKMPQINETNSVPAKLGRISSHDLRVFAALGTIYGVHTWKRNTIWICITNSGKTAIAFCKKEIIPQNKTNHSIQE